MMYYSQVPAVLSQDAGSAAVMTVARPQSEILATPSPVSRMLEVFKSLQMQLPSVKLIYSCAVWMQHG